MCGRFTAGYTWAELHALYKLSDDLFSTGPRSNMQPRYNMAPTQDVDFVAYDKGGKLTAAGTLVAGPVLAQSEPVQRPDRDRRQHASVPGCLHEPPLPDPG